MYILGVCSNPDILKVINLIKIVITGIMIATPIILIVVCLIDTAKLVADPNPDVTKNGLKIFLHRFIACAIIMAVPFLVKTLTGIVGTEDYTECISLATPENISQLYVTRAETAVALVEKTLTRTDLSLAQLAVNKLEYDTTRENLQKRLDTAEASIVKKEEEEKEQQSGGSSSGSSSPGGPIDTGTGSGSNGNGTCRTGTVFSSEPNPADPMSCWPNIIAMSKFTFPVDNNGRKLGSFPKNYNSIPTQLTSYKTYHKEFIIPVTPANGKWSGSYHHNGIDIIAVFGTPIYSPVDGTLVYSEWGHTGNKGWDETAYSASIIMDRTVSFAGKQLGQVFITHMSGIRYRCNPCNMKVKKGQLIGFVGNAAGSATSGGWAPHLHMSIHPKGDYSAGIMTDKISELYGITAGMSFTAGG